MVGSCKRLDSVPQFLMALLNNIKMYHWQTYKYAQHIATDTLYNTLEGLVDNFIEAYSSNKTRPKGNFDIRVYEFTKDEFIQSLEDAVSCLDQFDSIPDISTRSDLKNIRDEMRFHIEKTLYLLTQN